MSYVRLRSLGDDSASFPWMRQSPPTLALQADTNGQLKVAGYCPIPSTGILDGNLCGARNFLTLNSKKLFGKQIEYSNPTECNGHEDEWSNPIGGCFKPGRLPLSKNEWILIGGATSTVLVVWLLSRSVKAKGTSQ